MFCCFHCHRQRFFMLHSTAWTNPIYPKCIHILQGDMEETVVNKFSIRICENKCPFCKESQRKVNQNKQQRISRTLGSCEDFIKNIITNSDGQKLVYEYGNMDFPAKEVGYHHKCWLELTYQVSNQNPRTLPFLMMPTPTHFHTFKHMSLTNLNRNPLLFPFKGSFGTYAQTEI